MKHSRKMILTDYNANMHLNEPSMIGKSRIIDLKSPEVRSGVDDTPESVLDNEILKILRNRRLSEYEKARQYNQILRKYLIAAGEVLKDRKTEKEKDMSRFIDLMNEYQSRSKGEETLSDYESLTPAMVKRSQRKEGFLTNLFNKYPASTSTETVSENVMPSYVTTAKRKRASGEGEVIYDASTGKTYLKKKNLLYEYDEDSLNSEALGEAVVSEDLHSEATSYTPEAVADDFQKLHITPQGGIKKWEKLRRT